MTNKLYDSIEVYNPSNQLIFMCNTKKIKWYEKKNLIKKLDENKYMLLFEPKGIGHTNDYLKERLENKCVVCGCMENLTLHHILPYAFKKYFPEKYKSSNHFDLFALCETCHRNYELKANDLRMDLLKNNFVGEVYECFKLAKSLKDVKVEKSKFCILKKLQEQLNLLTDDQINVFLNYSKNSDNFNHGTHKFILENYLKNATYESFILMWREHFLSSTNPKFISKKWLNDYKTFFYVKD